MSSSQMNTFDKTLEQLEKSYWPPIREDERTRLVETCHQLRKKKLGDYTIEDLRCMVGQEIGLKYIIPLALDELEKDILAEGDFYEGDLLKFVLTSKLEFWKEEKENWDKMVSIFKTNEDKLEAFDTSGTIKKGWFEAFDIFKKINSIAR